METQLAAADPAAFKASRFTIRIKLLVAITGIVVLALAGMLLVAAAIFRAHGESLIQYYNLLLVRQNGQAVAQRLRDLDGQARLLESLLGATPAGGPEEERRAGLFFRRNPRVLYLGVAGPAFAMRRELVHTGLLAEYKLERAALDAALQSAQPVLSEVFAGGTAFRNLSPELKLPALAIALPAESGDETALVLIVLAEDLLGVARAGGDSIFRLALVDARGAVIAHTDEAVTLARADFQAVPIVRLMAGSTIDNGSLEYVHEGVEYLGSFFTLDLGSLGVVSTVEADQVFKEVERLQRQTAVIMLIVFVLVFLFVFFYSRTLSVPIVKLVGATRMVEAGHYDVAIRPAAGDEIGILTNSFVHMAAGLKEKERIKDVFGKFVNPRVAELALAAGPRLGGERKLCAIFFSDLRNFTGMSEGMTPETVVDILNQYFTAMVACVHEQDGIVDKFIGDAIMAHWGAMVTRADDTARAVDAALAMRRALVELNRRLVAQGLPALRFGCGINTGEVIAGQIGSETRLEYTVIGDAVNLASRIEFLNKHFGTDILISSAAFELVRGRYRVIPSPQVKIKGKTKPEVVYAVLGAVNDAQAPRDLKALRAMVHIEYDPARARESLEQSSDALEGGASELVGG